MRKLKESFLKDPSENYWNRLIESEKSLTKRNLTKFLLKSSEKANIFLKEDFLNEIFITNAIMCARQGTNYRSNNIKIKESTQNCSEFLKQQIEIVKPKIILTLGYYPLYSLSKIFGFPILNNLSSTIAQYPFVKVDDYLIIPLYHPAAQVNEQIQLKQYEYIWNSDF